MSKAEALNKWSDACTVCECGPTYVRDGNWTTIAKALRHCSDTSTVVEKSNLNGDTVVLVTPAKKEVDPQAGKTPINLPPFLMVVR